MPFDTIRMGASAAGAYEIERSLKFIRGDGHRLNRTPSSASNRKTWTFSCWVKLSARTGFDKNGIIFNAGPSGTGNNLACRITNTGTIGVDYYGVGGYYSTGVLRDPSAWCHCVWRVDTTDSTAANRVKVYVNGELFFNTQAGFSEDDDTPINNNVEHTIGVYSYDQTHDYTFGGYMAEVHFVDGTALDASAFGETNTDTGQWIPKKFAGAYGTNGFKLDFSDNSAATAAAIGKDSSGNGHNWTPTNISVAAGAGNDSLIDTPTNNFCVANQLDKGSVDVDRGGMIVSRSGDTADWELCHGTMEIPSSGKWYWEGTINGSMDGTIMGVGIRYGTSGNDTNLDGENDVGHYYWNTAGYIGYNGSYTSSGAGAGSAGNVIGVAFDRDNDTLWVAINGTWGANGGGTPVTPSDPIAQHTSIPANVLPLIGCRDTGQVDMNFGQRPFEMTKPDGYQALCTANLPEPTIIKGTDYYGALLWTGTDSVGTRLINGLDFNPDLHILKSRTVHAGHWGAFDSVRGVTAGKETLLNAHSAEGTEDGATYGYITPGTGGFTYNTGSAGAGNGNANYNWVDSGTGATYVAYNWKESATAGFDIVAYTGTGSATTVSHSLGVAPELIVVKNLTDGASVPVSISGIVGTGSDTLYWGNKNNAASSQTSVFPATLPTSSVFSVGTHAESNASSKNYIAYLWTSVEGYSKLGVYVGNGNSSGPYIHLGFRPAFLLIKCTSNAENWNVFDAARDPDNYVHHSLVPNNTAQENNSTTARRLDFYSNGVKLRGSDGTINTSGYTYMYMAFAERPFKYANAR